MNQATGVFAWRDQVGQDPDSTPSPSVQFDGTRSALLTDVDAIAGRSLFQNGLTLRLIVIVLQTGLCAFVCNWFVATNRIHSHGVMQIVRLCSNRGTALLSDC